MMKKLLILGIIVFMIIAACGKKDKPEIEAESQVVNTPAQFATTTPLPEPSATPKPDPTPTAPKPTEIIESVNEGSVSPIVRSVSPLPAPVTEIGGAMDVSTLSSIEQSLVAKSKEALLQLPHATLKADEISLLSMESREWRDASLGCPKPGMMYAQVITSGYLMVLETGGSQYEFHTNTKDQTVLCTIDGQDASKVLAK